MKRAARELDAVVLVSPPMLAPAIYVTRLVAHGRRPESQSNSARLILESFELVISCVRCIEHPSPNHCESATHCNEESGVLHEASLLNIHTIPELLGRFREPVS